MKGKNIKKYHDFDYELDDYEKELTQAIERGEFKSVPNFAQEKRKLMEAARLTLEKNKNINIRISQGDLYKVKSKAAEQGIPYQTLISSLIHQYSHGRIDYNVLREPKKDYK